LIPSSIPDMVRHGVTGALAPAGDVRALREMMRYRLSDARRLARMAENWRRVAVAEYALEVQTRRCMALYESILAAT
jgi:glycosyltransferase involved in cell wall biosynthesis